MNRAAKWTAVAIAALVLVRVLVVVVALDTAATSAGPRIRHGAARDHATVLPGDVRRYHQIATRQGTPYVDFEVEYPPLTLAAVELLDGRDVRESTVNLMWCQLVVDLMIAGVLAWGWGRRAAIAYLVLGLVFLWYPFLYLRLDLLSVLLAVAALAAARKRHRATGAAALAVACFAKLWPIVLVPRLLATGSRRARLGSLAVFAMVGAIGSALWLGFTGTDGPEQVLTFRGADGWQVESTFGALVHAFGRAPARIEQGAMRLGVVPDVARVGLPLLGVGLMILVWWLAARRADPMSSRPGDDVRVFDGLAPLGAIAATLVTATILSPQYVSWLLPFAAIAWCAGERAVVVLTAVAGFLSTVGLNMVKELNQGGVFPLAVVIVRNALLITLLVVVIARLVQIGRRAGRATDFHAGFAVAPSQGVAAPAPTPAPSPAPVVVSASSDVGSALGQGDQVPATITTSSLGPSGSSLGPSGGLLAPRRDRRS
jgi:hypothetical protein